MGMFSFISDAVKSVTSPLLGVVNSVGKAAGGILNATGLGGLIGPLSGMLGSIPGFGGTFGGLLKMLPELLQGKIDLLDAIKIGSIFLPPPASAIAGMADLDKLTGKVLEQVGETVLDPRSPEGENVLTAAQNVAWSLFA